MILLATPILLTFCGASDSAFSITDADQSFLPAVNGMMYYEDTTGKMDTNRLATLPIDQFTPAARGVWRSNHVESNHWFRFEFKNQSSTSDWSIEFDHLYIEDMSVQIRSVDGILISKEFGYRYPFSERGYDYRNYVIDTHLPKDTPLQLIIRLKSRSMAQLVMTMATRKAWVSSVQSENLFFGLYFGGIFLLIIYNIGVGIALRSRLHFFYILHVVTFGFDMANFNGFSYQYLWPDVPYLDYYMKNISICLSSMAIFAFCREILELRKYNRLLDYILLGGIAFNVILIVLIILGVAFNQYLFIMPIATVAICLIAAVARLMKRSMAAMVYLIAWIPFGIGGLIHLFAGIGLADVSGITRYIIQIASGLEILIMAFVLTSRVGAIEARRQRAESEVTTGRRMMSMMSHELRTPLNGLMGMNRLLLATTLTDIQREMALLAYRSGQLTLGLINNILDFAAGHEIKITLHKRDANLRELFNDVISITQSQAADKDLQMESHFDTRIQEFVEIDPDRFRQILLNLATNAVKYTTAGKITASAMLIINDSAAQRVRFSVIDTGIGIDAAHLSDIFKPYFRERIGTSAGMGLGLTISKLILDAMSSRFEVVSTAGSGSEFSFCLDLPPAKSDSVADSDPTVLHDATRYPQLSQCRVLIVDDEPLNRRVVAEFLAMSGISSMSSTNGLDALKLIEIHDYDVILLDWWMPEMSGKALAQAFRENRRTIHIPIVGITALHEGIDDFSFYFESGINDIISKPIDPDTLIGTVGKWFSATRGEPVRSRHQALRLGEQEDWNSFVVEASTSFEQRFQALSVAIDERDPESALSNLHTLCGIIAFLGFFDEEKVLQSLIVQLRSGIVLDQMPNSLRRCVHFIRFTLDSLVASLSPAAV